jgi:glycosyltransferase involved in cell wall biosynthesis/SAM-dependent methyltransferase
MKILYLLHRWPKISLKFVLNEMTAIQGHGHEVHIVALCDAGETITHDGMIPCQYWDDLGEDGVVEFVKTNQIDHIHSHFAVESTEAALRIHTQTGVPFSFTTHAFDLYKRPSPQLREWCEAAKCVFTISEYNKRYMNQVFGVAEDKIYVVRCGVLPDKLKPQDYSSQPFRIISVCRSVEKKGLENLIAACKELKRRGVDFTCEIVTEGQINEPEVTVISPMVHPEIVDFIRSGSVFVLPCIQAKDGDRDGIPVVLMEAMALRVPVISTNMSGIPELISNRENGLLVSPDSVEELVDAILEVKNKKDLVARMRGCSRERVLQSYNIHPNTKKMLTAIEPWPTLDDYDLPPIRFLENKRHDVMDIGFAEMTNIFNPSFHFEKNESVFSYMAIPERDNRIMSFVVIRDSRHTKVDISAYGLEAGCLQLIDPKTFSLDDGCYVTFNSGHVSEGNDIFVMKVYPEVEPPKRIIYDERQRQERNWAFFSRDGETYALYWLNPLKILKLHRVTDDTWEFRMFYEGGEDYSDITQGTPLAEHEGKYYFMGHKKHIVNGKKLYLGKSGCFDFDACQVEFGEPWFAHSPESLHGVPTKHNTNLFSCTYFSGIQIIGGRVILGYGVNDVDFCSVQLTLDEFMGGDMASIFGEIYEKKMWGGETAPRWYSGRGSNDENTEQYREYLQQFIQKYDVKSVVDVGCGDFRLGQLMDWSGLSYTGVEVVPELVERNAELYASPNVKFIEGDITEDELPEGELCLVRQVFQHFSNSAIQAALPKLRKFKYVLITDAVWPSEKPHRNLDKQTNRYGRFDSGLYLESPPFSLDAEVVLSYPSRNEKEVFRTLLVQGELGKRHWDEQANYEQGYSKVMNRSWEEAKQDEMHNEQASLLRELDIWDDARVLEVGSGMGRLTKEVLGFNASFVHGLDISSEMLRFAEDECVSYDNKQFEQHDLKDGLPFADDSFDVVFEWSVLLHILNDGTFNHVLREMARVSSRYVVIGMDMPDKEQETSYFKRRTRQQHKQPLFDAGYSLLCERDLNGGAFTLALFEKNIKE